MEEEEQQQELRCTGSDVEIEEYTDTEDSPCVAYRLTSDKLLERRGASCQQFAFILTLLTVVLSVTVLVITYPLYLESVSAVSNAYTALLFTALGSALTLAFVYLLAEKMSPDAAFVPNSMRIRITGCALSKIGLLYGLCGILLTLSLEENRVLCHLQDPMKGITLLFSLVYYFFFCRKMMSLQRIFASTTIIVGLFISVDYGLCDEFRCRGREISRRGEESPKRNWAVTAIWTFVYVAALAAFAMFFTMLERHYTNGQQNVCPPLTAGEADSFLYTVSRLVSSRDIRRRGSEEEGGRLLHVTDPDPTVKPKNFPKPPILRTLLHVHGIALLAVVAFCWLDALPGIGRGLSPLDLYRTLQHGLWCHFKSSAGAAGSSCSNVSGHAWTFLLAYVLFSISSVNFLSMCESAVFSVAVATVSLPLSGIWWSLYKVNVNADGASTISWSPAVTGELICALLGLPVVLLGLALLVRSHFRDTFSSYPSVQPSHLQPDPYHG